MAVSADAEELAGVMVSSRSIRRSYVVLAWALAALGAEGRASLIGLTEYTRRAGSFIENMILKVDR
jgi:hypothetical protein